MDESGLVYGMEDSDRMVEGRRANIAADMYFVFVITTREFDVVLSRIVSSTRRNKYLCAVPGPVGSYW